MSKRQKGRKHRTVNRTPRPRGPAGQRTTPEAVSAAATGGPTAASASAPAAAAGAEPGPASGSSPGGAQSPGGETYGPVFTSPAREGGLGRPTARTWEALGDMGEQGCTAEELSSAAGFTAATVRKHLTGLARYGLAEQRGDRWFRTGKSQWDAVPENGSAPAAPR